VTNRPVMKSSAPSAATNADDDQRDATAAFREASRSVWGVKTTSQRLTCDALS
jgi:hypothetical protein